jgi:restriction endonuclease S subunit
MRKTLQSIAKIRSGYTFRQKITEVTEGNVHILQIGDLRRQHTELQRSELQADILPKVNWQDGNSALLPTPSVVVPARGEYHRASLFNGTAKVIASSQLHIITITDMKVLPTFVCWAINQKSSQHYLANEARGSNIPSISINSLASMEIQIPTIETQQRIIELQQLWEQEQQLTRQLLSNRKVMLEGMFQQLLSGAVDAPLTGEVHE